MVTLRVPFGSTAVITATLENAAETPQDGADVTITIGWTGGVLVDGATMAPTGGGSGQYTYEIASDLLPERGVYTVDVIGEKSGDTRLYPCRLACL